MCRTMRLYETGLALKLRGNDMKIGPNYETRDKISRSAKIALACTKDGLLWSESI